LDLAFASRVRGAVGSECQIRSTGAGAAVEPNTAVLLRERSVCKVKG
jgi:hypothetical protein